MKNLQGGIVQGGKNFRLKPLVCTMFFQKSFVNFTGSNAIILCNYFGKKQDGFGLGYRCLFNPAVLTFWDSQTKIFITVFNTGNNNKTVYF